MGIQGDLETLSFQIFDIGGIMLACGQYVQPHQVVRELETFPSSTEPVKVLTDEGVGYIKATNNRQGTDALVSEIIAGEIGVKLGLQIPPFAVICRCAIELRGVETGRVLQPPFFFSSHVDSFPFDKTDLFLKTLASTSDVALLVLFDTLIRNFDRYGSRDENQENLRFARAADGKKFDLIPIDHSLCFFETGFELELPAPEMASERKLYGNFPEFAKYLTEDAVYAAVSRMEAISTQFIHECVESIPAAWRPPNEICEHLKQFLIGRTEHVRDTFPALVLPQMRLPGVE